MAQIHFSIIKFSYVRFNRFVKMENQFPKRHNSREKRKEFLKEGAYFSNIKIQNIPILACHQNCLISFQLQNRVTHVQWYLIHYTTVAHAQDKRLTHTTMSQRNANSSPSMDVMETVIDSHQCKNVMTNTVRISWGNWPFALLMIYRFFTSYIV